MERAARMKSPRATAYPTVEAMKASLKQPLIFDGRNLYEPALMRQLGLEHVGVGRRAAQ